MENTEVGSKKNKGKQRVFSGVQPTGKLHIGNYVGALSLWGEIQKQYDNIFCIVDQHAITIPETIRPDYLRKKTREAAALFIASGIDPEQSAIFIQSHVSEHAELTWVLNCVTPMGWLERMTQYKVKAKELKSVGTGLFDYPVLQASDILLYDTNFVPVGEDQKQHIELARDIALRFNNLFGEAFVLPEPLIRESGARIMGFDNPEMKMSKSIGEAKPGHSVGLLDTPDEIKKTIMRAVTDSGTAVDFGDLSPGLINLFTVYEILSGKSREETRPHFEGKGYGFLKGEVTEVVIETLKPVQEKYRQITDDPDFIEQILEQGANRVKPTAEKTFKLVKELVGLG